jgi:hypothetical protein
VRFCDDNRIKRPGKLDLSQRLSSKMRLSAVQAVRFCDNRMNHWNISIIAKTVQDNAIIGCASCEIFAIIIKRLGKLDYRKDSMQDNAIIGCATVRFCDNRIKRLGKTRFSQKIVRKMRLSHVQAVRFCDNRMKRPGIIQTSKLLSIKCDYRMCKLWDFAIIV